MSKITCPKCTHRFQLSHSAFVTGREKREVIIDTKDYYPDPTKTYKTKESNRRIAMTYYWKNREAVLLREKRRRAIQPDVHVKIKDN